ncbi:MAG: 50S ribosomal protein L21e [Candidatus Nanohaloarchaea archaeon]
MAQKSKGSRRKTRRKLAKDSGVEGTISNRLESFEEGEKVVLDIDPSVQEGMPHPRFHGRTGRVVEGGGRNYVVKVEDGGKHKELVSNTAHLEPVED